MSTKTKALKNFCKSVKTSNSSMEDLYKMFETRHYNTKGYMTREEFEVEMLKLNKKAARLLKDKCQEYFVHEGEFGYTKFCKEVHFVSPLFWSKVTADLLKNPPEVPTAQTEPAPVEDPYEMFHKLLPANWVSLDKSDRINFIKKIKHEKFKEYVLSLDENVRKFFEKAGNPKSSGRFTMYTTLFQFPENNYSEEAKNLLKCFVETIDSLGRACLQYMVVDINGQKTVEIREVR